MAIHYAVLRGDFGWLTVVLVLAACAPRARPVEGLEDPVLLAGSGAAFCALDARGVACWPSDHRRPIGEPVRVEGIGKAREIAMTFYHACALDELGVACWTLVPMDPAAVRAAGLEGATQIVAVKEHFCAIAGAGVLCWEGPGDDPVRIEGAGSARKLHAAGWEFCVGDGESLRCFRYQSRADPPFYQPTAWVSGLHDPEVVTSEGFLGKLTAFEKGSVFFARFDRCGSPDPAAVFPAGPDAAVAVGGLDGPTMMVRRDLLDLVLDEEGVKGVFPENGPGSTSMIFPTGGRPERIWPGPQHFFFGSDGTSLAGYSTRTVERGRRWEIDGVSGPEQVAFGFEAACVLDSGGVKCWRLRGNWAGP